MWAGCPGLGRPGLWLTDCSHTYLTGLVRRWSTMEANHQEKAKVKIETVRTCRTHELPEVIIGFSRAGYALAYHPCCQGFSSNSRQDLLKHPEAHRWGMHKASLGLKQSFTAAQACTALGLSEGSEIRFNMHCLAPRRSSSDQPSRG